MTTMEFSLAFERNHISYPMKKANGKDTKNFAISIDIWSHRNITEQIFTIFVSTIDEIYDND